MKEYGSGQFDRRQYPRLDFTIPIAFQKQKQSDNNGLTSNGSLGGMLAFLPYAIRQGEILQLTMLLPCSDGKKVFNVTAETVWVVPDQTTTEWVCKAGLKFIEIPPDSYKVWRTFLTEWQGDKDDVSEEV